MSLKYRSRTDMIAEILRTANGYDDVTRTRIKYGTYLSSRHVKEYIAILIQNGLLEYKVAEKIYKTTEKGLKFLKVYEQMQELTTTTDTNNNNIMDGNTINKRKNSAFSIWEIAAVAPIIITAVIPSLLSLAASFT